ncbi:hypothetical protein Pcinc_000763 [Petrolisthes cinctipes]|uniref:C2H2-type domain-containing protein n=1 Tax=Petrolisthes cinctipes TaxID=88211 RepID=A0AAE1L6C0_PETCI|nr:hypothetical protein Pcinc_000763 [Petrolisthes cinctipes]
MAYSSPSGSSCILDPVLPLDPDATGRESEGKGQAGRAGDQVNVRCKLLDGSSSHHLPAEYSYTATEKTTETAGFQEARRIQIEVLLHCTQKLLSALDSKKGVFVSKRSIDQARLQSMQDAWLSRKADEIQGFADRHDTKSISTESWEILATDRPTWRSHIQQGAKRAEEERTKMAEKKRELRKARAASVTDTTPTHMCPTCGRGFRTRIGLISHLRTHHPRSSTNK